MKKQFILFALLLLTIPSVSYSQTEKGSIYINGASNFSFVDSSPGERNGSNFSVQTFGGYFLGDNFLMGLGLGASENGSFTTYSLGLKARGYLDQVMFFGIGYYATKVDIRGGGIFYEGNRTQQEVLFEAGFPIFFNEHVSLEPTFNYVKATQGSTKGAMAILLGFGIYF